MSELDWLDTDEERGMSEYNRGYTQGRIDFAKEVIDKISYIDTCYGEDFDNGVDWAVYQALKIIDETMGDSEDGK